MLSEQLDEEVIVYIPDAPPIYSKTVVIDLFNYLWTKDNGDSEIEYSVTSIKKVDNQIKEAGIYSSSNNERERIEMPYSIVCIKKDDKHLIKEVDYNNAKKEIRDLPEPTGIYNVGQSIHYYGKNTNSIRPIAFQIWYPTLESSENNLPFQSKNVAQAISDFLGWPSFNNSFTRLMSSNSQKDVTVVPNKKFPVLLYNHGYGGATTVYQTVFEELASHGYIVVSIGHQDESAFLLKEDGSVIQNYPSNEFFAKRGPEINNTTVGTEQSVILNSNDPEAITEAYKNMVKLTPLHAESVKLWALDTKHVIRKLEELNIQNQYLKGGMDFRRLGVFGHSAGGATAGELGSNNRFKAGINIDGFQFGKLINSRLEIPFLFISSNERDDRYLRVIPFANSSNNDVYHAIIEGFSHSSFSDLELFTPSGENGIKLQRKLILEFFNKHLKDDDSNFEDLMNHFPNLSLHKLN